MKIDLEPNAEAWLNAQVAKGRYSSLDEALSAAVSLMQQIEDNSSKDIDDAWTKPYIEEALADVKSGKVRQWKKGDTLKELHTKYAHLIDADNP